jgi:phage gp29-like protein
MASLREFASLAVDFLRPKREAARPAGRPASVEREITEIATGDSLVSMAPLSPNRVEIRNPDDLIRRHKFKIYRDMRFDDQVKLALRFKKILVYGRAWDVKAASKDARDLEIAAFVRANMEAAGFKKLVRNSLTAFDFGFSCGEILWEVGLYEGQRAVLLKGVKHRDPDSIRIIVTKGGDIVGFEQWTDFGKKIDIPPEKMFHFAYQAEFDNHYGTSDLRACYRNWWAKKFLIQFWSVFLERLGAPMTLAKYPQGAAYELKETIKNILRGLSSKTEVMVPQGVEIEVIESTKAAKGDFDAAIKYHDSAIGRAILMPGLLGASDHQGRGAESQSRLQLRSLFKDADENGNELLAELHRQIVKPLVDYNFAIENDAYPTVVLQDYGEFEAVEIADAIRQLFNVGVLDMDQADVNYTRKILGMPIRGEDDDEDEVLRPQPAPLPQSGMGAGADGGAGGPTGTGNTKAEK